MRTLLFAALISCLACESTKLPPAKLTFFVGTYTRHEGHVDGKGDGIYKMTFDPATLDLQVTDTIKGMTNPSYLALSAKAPILYAVNEIVPGGSTAGQFEAYDISENAFGLKSFSAGTGSYAPCHIALDTSESLAMVSNYLGGIVAVYALPVKENTQAQIIQLPSLVKPSPRQESSHPHSALFSTDGHMAFVADLGTDRIMIYQVDEGRHQLTPAPAPYFELAEGSGPRHMALSADGKILYVLCELSNNVAVLDLSGQGELTQRQLISTLPAGYQGQNYTADIHIAPNGKFLYASNRGHNSIAVFKTGANGVLESAGQVGTQGRTPRNFHLTHDGNWMLVANQDTGNIALFDLRKGDLPVFVKSIQVNTPVSIVEMK